MGQTSATVETPPDITSWFADLAILRGVPFNYLVPDPSMLPAESIRFFRLDGLWVDCLLDGAFSIGRVTRADYEQTQVMKEGLTGGGDEDEVTSGFLLRSNVVAGWPGLLVDAFDADDHRLDSRRFERLSESVLLCLFSGDVRRAEIHQRPEMLHFGLDEEGQGLFKKLRNAQGEEGGPEIESGAWLQAQTRVVNVEALASAIASKTGDAQFTSAQFALQMIEGVERVALYAAQS